MKFTLLLLLALFTSTTAQAKPFSFGVITGIHYGEVQHETAPTDSEAGLTLGPAAYFNLGRVTLRSSLVYQSKSITVGESDLFFFFFQDQTNIDFDQLVLSVGAQFNINRRVGIFGDLDYAINTFGFECYELGSNSFDFDCADAEADLKDNVLHFKAGASINFVHWLRLEPYLSFSLTDYGKDQLQEAFFVGTNVSFTW